MEHGIVPDAELDPGEQATGSTVMVTVAVAFRAGLPPSVTVTLSTNKR